MRNVGVVICIMTVILWFGFVAFSGCTDEDDDDDFTPTATVTPGEETPTPTPTATVTPTSTPTPEPGLGILNIWTTPVYGDIYVEGRWMGWGLWQGELPVGPYIVSFGDVAGYFTPEDVVAHVLVNETTHVEGLYVIVAGYVYTTDPIVGNVRYIPAGTFTQGSPIDEPGRYTDEPQFNHTLTRNIAVMETEVTRQMWADLLAVQPTLPADPSDTGFSPTMTHPVTEMTWYESVLFANLLSLQNVKSRCYFKDATFTVPVDGTNYTSGTFYCDFSQSGYRLLSEGEWEYSARAGTIGPFSCNETNYTSVTCNSCTAGTLPTLEQYAVYCANNTNKSEPAGSKHANPWNLKDMHGNMWEWCWDWYSAYPGDSTDYTGSGSGSTLVARGGGWSGVAGFCRSACRASGYPGVRYYAIGFRLVRSVP